MNNLINVQNKEGQLLVSSREVARNFEKRNSEVNRAIENHIQTLENTDSAKLSSLFIENKYTTENANGVHYKEYLLTRDGFTLVAMGFTGVKALNWKLKYIDAFNKMEQALRSQSSNFKIDSKFMYQLAEELERKEKQIALMKPKAIFADAIATSKQSVLVGELAKIIAKNGVQGIGQNRLFQWLRDNGYLHKKGEQYNLPTQYSIELGIMEVKVTTINNPGGSVRVAKTPKITGKGQIYFVNKFIRNHIA